MEIKVAVLLTVYNRKEITIRCLRNIFSQKLVSGQILHVYLTDDGSNDGTPEEIKLLFPQVNIINGDGTLFWNRGMWKAWECAKEKEYDAYLWLNNDTFLYDYSISTLISLSSILYNKCIVVGAVESTKEKGKVTYSGYIKGRRLAPNGELQQVDYFNGNIVLIPKYVFNLVGNLDYSFRHSLGDFDYGLRAKKLGVQSYLTNIYIGECDRHEKLNDWCNPNISLRMRMYSLFLPTGYNPKEVFYFERKHKNIFIALFHQFTLLLRLLFPSLWIQFDHNAKP